MSVRDRLKLGIIDSLNGNCRIQLFDEESGQCILDNSKDNLVLSSGWGDLFLRLMMLFIANRSGLGLASTADIGSTGLVGNMYTGSNIYDHIGLVNSIYLNNDTDDPLDPDIQELSSYLAYSSCYETYSGSDTTRGTINLTESYVDVENRKIRFVFDWPTSAANGSFQSVALCKSESVSPSYHPLTRGLMIYYKPCTRVLASNNNTLRYAVGIIASGDTTVVILNSSNSPIKFNSKSIDDFETLPRLKDDSGNVYSIASTAIRNGYLYVAKSSTRLVYRYPLTDLTVNGTAFDFSAISTGVGYVLALEFVSDSECYVLFSGSSTDVVTGLPWYRYLYRINISTMNVISRLPRACSIASAQVNPGLIIVGDILYEVYNSSATSAVVLMDSYDIVEETSKSTYMKPLGSSQSTYHFSHDGKIIMAGAGTASDAPHVGKTFCLYELIPSLSRLTRVVMPAPVTKLNTQTLKVTYDLIFPESMFGI